MIELSKESVFDAIASVIDPVFERPMLEMGLIEDVQIQGERVNLKIRLASSSDRVKKQIEESVAEALGPLEPSYIGYEWNLQVPMREQLGDDPAPGIRNVLLVMSGKGGVGKSTVAANLAIALARSGCRVGLLDADIYGPSVPTMFGISGHPKSDGAKITPLERFGLKLMSIGFLLENDKQAVVWRGPMLHGALNQFLNDVQWGELDYLVLDLPPGTGDVALTVAQRIRSTGAVVVTTPQEVAIQDVYKSVSMCDKLHIPILGVIENMSFFIDTAGVKHEIFGRGGGQKIADFAKAPLLAQVPIDQSVRKWGDEGTPVMQADPTSPAAIALKSAADEVATIIARDHFIRLGANKVPGTAAPTRLKIVR